MDLSKHNIIVNLTPHPVRLIAPGCTPGDGWTWPAAEGGIARCAETLAPEGDGYAGFDPFGDGGMQCRVPIVRRSFGEVTGLPPAATGCAARLYIVSQIVADACPHRDDLLVPADIVRGNDGQIAGCRSFAWRPATVISGEDLEILATEAALAGDENGARVIDAALAGDSLSREACRRALAAASLRPGGKREYCWPRL